MKTNPKDYNDTPRPKLTKDLKRSSEIKKNIIEEIFIVVTISEGRLKV